MLKCCYCCCCCCCCRCCFLFGHTLKILKHQNIHWSPAMNNIWNVLIVENEKPDLDKRRTSSDINLFIASPLTSFFARSWGWISPTFYDLQLRQFPFTKSPTVITEKNSHNSFVCMKMLGSISSKCLHVAFTCADLESPKNCLTFFALLGSAWVKVFVKC